MIKVQFSDDQQITIAVVNPNSRLVIKMYPCGHFCAKQLSLSGQCCLCRKNAAWMHCHICRVGS